MPTHRLLFCMSQHVTTRAGLRHDGFHRCQLAPVCRAGTTLIRRATPVAMPIYYFPHFFMAQSKESEMSSSSQKPIHSLRYRGVSAAIFANETKIDGRTVIYHKVALQRYYKDGDEWKVSNGFSRDDLPVAMLLLQQVYEWILSTEAKRGKDAD